MKRSLKKGIAILTLAAPVLAGCNGTEKPHEHTFVKHDAIAATCAENGNILYYTCEGCDEFFDSEHNTITESETILAATGDHAYTTLSVKTMPTKQSYTALESFESAGLKLEKVCEVCQDKVEVTETPTFDKTVLHGNDSKVIATVGTLSVDIPVTVSKKQVAKPTPDTTTFTYTGEEQTYTVAASELYEVTGNSNKRTEVGSQQVTVALKNKTDYCWSDGSTDDLSFTFAIGKKAVTISGLSDRYDVKCHEAPTFEGVEATDSATVTTKVYSGVTEITDLTTLEAGEYTVKFSVAETANYAAAEVSRPLYVAHDFNQESKVEGAIKTAATCKAYAVYYKSCVCGEHSTDDSETFVGDTYAPHTKTWDRTSATEDLLKCSVCGDTLETFSKVPTVTTTQVLDLSLETVSVDVSTGATVKGYQSIKCGNYDLGTDPTNLNVAALKADAQYSHGPAKKLTVTALSNDDCAHVYEVPVDVVTKVIKTKADMEILNDYPTDVQVNPTTIVKARFGYYILANDIDYQNSQSNTNVSIGNQAAGFRGIFDGKGHTIKNYSPTWKPIISGIGYHAEVKNIKFTNVNYQYGAQHGILTRYCSSATLSNIEIELKGYEAFGSQAADENKLKQSALLYGNATGQTNTISDITVHAEGFEIKNLLGCNVGSDTFTNVKIYCKDYSLAYVNASGNVISKEEANLPTGVTVIKDPVMEEIDALPQAFTAGTGKSYTLPESLSGLVVSKVSVNSTQVGTDLANLDLSGLEVGEHDMVIEGTLSEQPKILKAKIVIADKIVSQLSDIDYFGLEDTDGKTDTKYYALNSDLTGLTCEESIKWKKTFKGVLNGCGHSMTFTSLTSNSGLFSKLDGAKILNTTFIVSSMKDSYDNHLLAWSTNATLIENCNFQFNVTSFKADNTSASEYERRGLVSGVNGGGPSTIKNCNFTVTTTGENAICLFGANANNLYDYTSYVKIQGTCSVTGAVDAFARGKLKGETTYTLFILNSTGTALTYHEAVSGSENPVAFEKKTNQSWTLPNAYQGMTISSITVDGKKLGNDVAALDMSSFTVGEHSMSVFGTKDSKLYELRVPIVVADVVVTNAAEFAAAVADTSGTADDQVYTEGYVALANDIAGVDATNASKGWKNGLKNFTFNGCGHTITVSGTYGDGGLFGQINQDSYIKNLKVVAPSFKEAWNLHVLAYGVNGAHLSNVEVDVTVTETGTLSEWSGCIIGHMDGNGIYYENNITFKNVDSQIDADSAISGVNNSLTFDKYNRITTGCIITIEGFAHFGKNTSKVYADYINGAFVTVE